MRGVCFLVHRKELKTRHLRMKITETGIIYPVPIVPIPIVPIPIGEVMRCDVG